VDLAAALLIIRSTRRDLSFVTRSFRLEEITMSPEARLYPMQCLPGYFNTHPGLQVGTQLSPLCSDEEIQFVRQLGVDWALIGDPGEHTVARYREIKRRFEDQGIGVYTIRDHAIGENMEEITLNLPGRDEKVAAYLNYVRMLGEAGIRYARYAHMGNGIWSSAREPIRGGATGRAFHLDAPSKGYWVRREWEGPLTHGRAYSEQEIWDNYAYFIERVVQVAEDVNVYVGIHPDDPPVPVLGGVPRPIFSSFEGYRRALEIADSDHVGVSLCLGCWLEGGSYMGKDALETIRYFGSQKRIWIVDFRNVSAPIPEGGFVETYMDAGYMNMFRVMRTLREVDYDGVVWSDHLPEMVGGRHAAEGYSVGYLRALVQAANTEAEDRAAAKA
jgi:mannonate dehydratase